MEKQAETGIPSAVVCEMTSFIMTRNKSFGAEIKMVKSNQYINMELNNGTDMHQSI